MGDSTGREIITLQVGRYANFVGTHFWNFQDEVLPLCSRGGIVDEFYDHSVLHRAPSSDGGVRSPRLIAFDTRDALGSLNPLGLVGAASSGTGESTRSSDAPSWPGGVSVFRQPRHEKNALLAYLDAEDQEATVGKTGSGSGHDVEFEDDDEQGVEEDAMEVGGATRLMSHPFGLDETVITWSDFLKSRLHPRALQELPFRDESSDFSLYTAGGGGSSSSGGGGGALGEADREAHSDALRRELEECDTPQGTQTLVDLEGGWGGLATALAVELGEECRNRPRICYALLRRDNAPAAPGCRTPGIRGDAEICKGGAGAARAAVNLALTLHGLTEACSLTCLLDEESCSQVSPFMAIDSGKPYHTSAVLGAALDLATSPLRFSQSARLESWASSRGGVTMGGGGGAFGGGERAPAPGSDMTVATLSAWFPFPHPDANGEVLGQMLHHATFPQSPGETDPRTSSAEQQGFRHAPVSAAGPSPSSMSDRSVGGGGMASLAPMSRKQKALSSQRQAPTRGDERVFSRTVVARGFTAPRADQLSAIAQVLSTSQVGAGSAYAVSTPLPIPITFPLVFRESVGSRGDLLSQALSNHGRGAGAQRGGGAVGGRREMRVMCDDISGFAALERSSTLGEFIGQVAEGLEMRRGPVLLELEKNSLHKDDAFEVLETLTGLAESYGFSPRQERDSHF